MKLSAGPGAPALRRAQRELVVRYGRIVCSPELGTMEPGANGGPRHMAASHWGHDGTVEGERDGAEGHRVSAERDAEAWREHQAGERERLAGEREQIASAREAQADQRERRADERERAADQREHRADERERAADERERRADERARGADEQEHDLDKRRRRAGIDVTSVHKRTLEAIDRARELLALSAKRLDRQEERLHRGQAASFRQQAATGREQAQIDRASAEAGRALAALPPDPSGPVEKAAASRRQAVRAISDLAVHQDEAARVYEQLATITPGQREDYQARAEQAREAAHKAREVLRTLTAD